ncbi:MAG: 6-carboxytetrahydropterin synthase, partial [Planctomycetia bacterium]|nr:6-carboxytetrahydropterin synthase [Planctomycetia bacterium]
YAHRLWTGVEHELVSPESRCTRLHGHNAVVELELTSESTGVGGMVRDFTDLERTFGAWIREHWDHRVFLHESDPLVSVLRGIPGGVESDVWTMRTNPTCELFAESLYGVARRFELPVSAVRFRETPGNQAEYRSDS